MPTYEYRCTSCFLLIEKKRPVHDRRTPIRCSCGHPAELVSISSSPGMINSLSYSDQKITIRPIDPALGVPGVIIQGQNTIIRDGIVSNHPVGMVIDGAKNTTVENFKTINCDKSIIVRD